MGVKDTKTKAIHNYCEFEQSDYALWTICQRYKNESNAQRPRRAICLFCMLCRSSPFWYRKKIV